MAGTLDFDYDSVTPRMLIDFKEKTGVPLMSFATETGDLDMASMPEECIAGIVWLALRMGGRPEATWDEALDTSFTSLGEANTPEQTADPSSAS